MSYRSRKYNDVNHLEADASTSSIKKTHSGNVLNIAGMKDLKIVSQSNDVLSIQGAITIRRVGRAWYVDMITKHEMQPLVKFDKICALDPGQRSFMSGIDLDGNRFQLATNNQGILKALKLKRNIAQSKLALLNKHRTHTYGWYRGLVKAKQDFFLSTQKIKNYIKQLHYHVCKDLVDRYDCIIIPVYQTQRMIQKGKRAFNEMILSLNHFSFRKLLISSARNAGKHVVVCNEEYTSKTCGKCNAVKMDLGSNKTYSCSQCCYKADRDENAAYNIMRFVLAGSLSSELKC